MNDDIKIDTLHADDYNIKKESEPAINTVPLVYLDWSHLKINKMPEKEMVEEVTTQKHRPFFFWFFAVGLFILVLSGLFFAYKFYFDKSKISSERISITNNITDEVKAGQTEEFQINISNGNKAPLKDVKLKYTYQKGFTREGEIDTVTKEFFFGDVLAASYISTSTNYLFIGSEGDKRNIKLYLTYKVEASNAEFNKSIEKEVKISTPLASIKIEGQKEVTEDYENVFTFKIKNLSLKNYIRSMLVVEMPNGFIIKKNQGEEANRFVVEDLPIGEEREFKVAGYFKNSIGETKNIRAYVAAINENDEVGASYASDVYEVNIGKSTVDYAVQIEVQGEKLNSFIVGKENNLELEIKNIGENLVTEVNIILTNKNTKEEYKWNNKTDESLEKITPASKVKVTKLINDFSAGKNTYTLEVFGKRRGEFNSVLLKKSEFFLEGR